MMLTKDEQDTHNCSKILIKDEGEPVCLSYHTQIKQIPKLSEINTKIYREKQLLRLLNYIVTDQSLVHIKGPLGIGKSDAMYNAFMYLLNRKYFTGGVILLDLDFQSEFSNFIRSMKKMIIKAFRLPTGDLRKKIDEADDEEFREILINIFQQNDSNFILNNQRFSNNKNKTAPYGKLRFLIGIDNAENLLIGSEKNEFNNFIKKLRCQCPTLHLVICSNKGKILDEIVTNRVYYDFLSPE